jgi:ABC-2 type transport system ATP-binding protein
MVQIEELFFGYTQNKPLFDQFNIEFPAGNIYGLLGKNGAGKSTLLKIISGLLFPTHGKVDVIGFQPKDRYPQFLSEIYLVTEECYVPDLSMKRFVDLYSPFYPRFNHIQFHNYIKEFQLPSDQKLTEISHGQKKKFLLSFGLATDCRLLILDEPTNGLDIPSKSQFRKVVASAIHEDRSFIISTHQVRDMENLIDPIIILDEGKVIFFETSERISSRLAFTKQSTLPDENTIIYCEPTLAGNMVVKENTTMEETNLNLEILFKAVVSNPLKVQEIFKRNN